MGATRCRIDSYGLTDTGRVRSQNEDQFLIADLRKSVVIHQSSLPHVDESELHGAPRAKLLMVADGMGGHAAGECASLLAVDGVLSYLMNAMHWLFRADEDAEDDFLDDLKAALRFSRERIRRDAEHSPENFGMGTTLTLAYVVWPAAYFVHVGDSRAYLLRDARLTRLSHDQTFAQALVDQGAISASDAESHNFAHVLCSALGCRGTDFTPAVFKANLSFDDKLLLCTDGLTRGLSERQIEELLNRGPGTEACCRRLIAASNEAGGRDNTTVAVASFHPLELDTRPSPPDLDCVADTISE